MKTRKILNSLLAAAAALIMATPAQATLQARDLDGNSVTDAFYDTTLNITWLRNANVNGLMDWDSAVAWAAGYSIGSYSDWRLPTMVDTGTSGCNFAYGGAAHDCGYNVDTATSEMAHLFYVSLGNLAPCVAATSTSSTCISQSGFGLTNTGDFQNLQSYVYWSGLEYAPGTNLAWYFGTGIGTQNAFGKYIQFYALAVRPGDVLAVPEPGTLVLAALALAGLGLIRRRALGASGL